MNNRRKQMIVLIIGLTLAFGGGLIRLTIRHQGVREPLGLLISLGQTKYPHQAAYADAVDAISTMSMGVFFMGLGLIFASIGGWLFLPSEHDTNPNNAS